MVRHTERQAWRERKYVSILHLTALKKNGQTWIVQQAFSSCMMEEIPFLGSLGLPSTPGPTFPGTLQIALLQAAVAGFCLLGFQEDFGGLGWAALGVCLLGWSSGR